MRPRFSLARHAPSERGLAGPESVAWQINREVVLLLGWAPAILMQFAHPLVAAGVADHSAFMGERRGRTRRFLHTLGAMLDLTFGTPDQVARAARGVNAIHDRVHGDTQAASPLFPSGTSYSAHDPELLRWVHATLLDVFPRTYRLFVGPLSRAQHDRYCQEAAGVEPLLGLPDGYLPTSVRQLEDYLALTQAGGEIAVTDTARHLAAQVLYPPFALPGRPLLALARLATVGLLPPPYRAAYGLDWGPRHQLALRALAALVRASLPLTPSPLRHWPAARAARRRQPAQARDRRAQDRPAAAG